MRPDLVNRIQAALADVAVWTSNEIDHYHVIRSNAGHVLIAIGVNELGGRRVLVPTNGEFCPKLEVSRTINAGYRELQLQDVEVQEFVQVDCRDSDLNPTFDSLLFELIDRIFEEKCSPLENLLEAISNWRRLLEAESKKTIRDKIVGLFGELHVLGSLVRLSVTGAVESWLGADGHRHDFTSPVCDLEVKTTAGINPNILKVSGTHQLREVGSTPLYLVRLGVVEHPSGDTVVERIGKLTEHGVDVEWMWQQVDKVMPREILRSYDDLRFIVSSEMYFRVDEDFPALMSSETGQGLPHGIVSVTYEIDLNTVESLSLDEVGLLHDEVVSSWERD